MTLQLIPRIHRATHAIGIALAAHPNLDVTQAEAHILAHLHESDGARISELHERFGHRRSTLTSVLDRLEGRSLLTRRIDPADRRAFVVTLTKSGRTRAAAVHRLLTAIERDALGTTAAQSLARVLDEVAARAETHASTRPPMSP